MSWKGNCWEDRLSHLPKEVVSRILSLMPTKFAVRTSILSKKWRYNWTLVTNLDLEDIHCVSDMDRFSEFVDRVLEHCKTSQLKLFRLCYVRFPVQKSNFLKWINKAVMLNVSDVDIEVWPTELPICLFTCKTLTKLRLAMVGGFDINNVLSPIMLPGLKSLDIRVFNKPCVTIMRFIHGCPVGENLSVNLISCFDDEQNSNFNLPTLKRLEISTVNSVFRSKFVLNVPNLGYFIVGGDSCPHFVVEDLPYSVEATVSICHVNDYRFHAELLLKELSGVKSLSWLLSKDNPFARSPLPKFPNLKHLELKGPLGYRWMLVIQILEGYSQLEHLGFEEPEGSCWIEPRSVPICILSNLKTIKITGWKGRECDIRFIEYMVGNAGVLKTLTIICGSLHKNEEIEISSRLLTAPRASRLCEIHFVGKYVNTNP